MIYLCNVEVTFRFSDADYRASEGPGAVMPVVISKPSVVNIATDVIFMVIPLTVDQALAQNVIDSFSTLDPFDPNRAGFSFISINIVTSYDNNYYSRSK